MLNVILLSLSKQYRDNRELKLLKTHLSKLETQRTKKRMSQRIF